MGFFVIVHGLGMGAGGTPSVFNVWYAQNSQQQYLEASS